MSDAALSAPVAAAPETRPAVEVEGVSASYRVRLDNESILTDLRDLVTRRGGRERLVPALRDVSFTVDRGSVLGVIGRNGAGKSTLLRVMGGILLPEAGRVVVRGELNLLAPGLGFDNNMTGRENIMLGGLAAGLSEQRLAEITEEVAEFAQLADYIDFPIRTYSAGMRSRLGFAVAAFLDPEILLIDEALSGGDAAFAERVRQRMAVLCGEGRTIVLVTHGLTSVRSMANEALWLHQGRVVEFGNPDEVVAKYMRYCRIEHLAVPDE